MSKNKVDVIKEYYKSIYENLKVALFRSNMDGKIIMSNSVLVEMLGHSSLKDLNRIEGLNKLDKWEELKKYLNERDEISELKSGWTLESGLSIFVEIRAKAVRNEKGEMLYIDGTAEVISNENNDEITLWRTDENYNDLMENSFTAHFVSGAKGKLLLCNSNYVQMFGHASKESAMGGNVAEMFMSNEKIEAFLDIIKNNKKVEKLELKLVKVDGHRINVLCNAVGEFDINGNLIKIKWFLLDITLKNIYQKEISDLTKVYSVLSEINRVILENQNLQVLFNECCKIAKDEGKYQGAAIFICNNENKSYDLKASSGMNKEYLREIENSIYEINGIHNYVYKMVSEYGSLIIDDIKNNSRLEHLTENKQYTGFTSILFLPLRAEGKIIGFFQLYSDNVNGFSPAEINLYNVFTNNISFAMDNYQRDIICSQTKSKLSESEKKYSSIFENVQDVLYKVSLDGIIIEISPSIKYFSEFSRADLIGKSVKKLYYDSNDRDLLLEDILEKGEIRDYEIKMKTSSGKIKYASINARLINDSQNKPHYINGSIRDITERVNAELELRKLKQAIEKSPLDIIITDIDGKIEYVNSNFVKQTGYTFEEIKGRNPRILKSDYHSHDLYKNVWETISSGNSWQGEILNKKKNEELYWADVLIVPISNNGKKITHFVSIEEDITDKKKMLDELILAKEKAEEINRIKSNFFAHMSHELRTPFVGIMGNAEYLSESLTKKEERELAEGIVSSSKRLMETLNKILEITKIESEKVEIHNNDVSINKMLQEVDNLYRKTALQKNLEFVVNQNKDNIIIKTDENLLSDILANLINNAIKYTKEGKIEIASDNILSNDNHYVTISIQDTGIGIPIKKHSIIWEEFRQASEGMNRNFEGAGLGLTIVKKYINLLNGKISLESEEGKGTKFTITLPYSVNDKIPVEKTNKNLKGEKRTPQQEELQHSQNKTVKILYVEDDETARFIVNKFLNKYYFIHLAENSNMAFKKILEDNYDMILMDINLKNGLNGIELTKIIRMLPFYQKIPIVAVTAYAHPDDKKEFLSKGFTDYISKPFIMKELNDIVEKSAANNSN